jgi:hypothetical protein
VTLAPVERRQGATPEGRAQKGNTMDIQHEPDTVAVAIVAGVPTVQPEEPADSEPDQGSGQDEEVAV